MPSLFAYAAGCLATFTEGCSANQQALLEVDGPRVLVDALRAGMEYPTVVSNMCVAIAHAAHRNAAVQAALVHAEPHQAEKSAQGVLHRHRRGAPALLLQAMAKFPGDVAVQCNAARAVATLAEQHRQEFDAPTSFAPGGVPEQKAPRDEPLE